MNLSTVYRTLEVLEELGLVTPRPPRPRRATYHPVDDARAPPPGLRPLRGGHRGVDARGRRRASSGSLRRRPRVRHRHGATSRSTARAPTARRHGRGPGREGPGPRAGRAAYRARCSRCPSAVPPPRARPDAGVAVALRRPARRAAALLARATAGSTSRTAAWSAVTGPDRLTWLHSLTTQHLERLAPGESALDADPDPARPRRARAAPRRRRRATWIIGRAGHRRRPGRLPRPDALHAARRGRRRHAPTAPWSPSPSARRHVAGARPYLVPVATFGRARPDDADVATLRARAAGRPGRPRGARAASDARGLRRRAPGSPARWAWEALRVAARRAAARLRDRPPHDPARGRLDAVRRPPAEGLLPRPGDGRARAQPRPAAAPARAAPPRRQRRRAHRSRATPCSSTVARSASSRRSRSTTSWARWRSPW